MTASRLSLAACLLAVLASPSLGDPSALVGVASARMGTLEPSVTAFGTLAADPNAQTSLVIPRDGIVVSVVVRAGRLVGKGDPIATIETAPAATAQFEQAKSALAFAQKDLDHTRALFSEQLATRSTLAGAEKAYADARAAFVHQQRIGADKTVETLTASVSGVVTSVAVSPGDHVSADAVIASIATRDRMVLNLGLEPRDAAQLAPGAKVTVTSAQDPTLNFVTQVASVDAMLDPQSRLVNAVIAIAPEVSRELILGMSLKAHIVLSAQRGIVIPKSALMTDEQGTFVYVVQKDHAHRRDVTIGLETSARVLIAKGLAAREVVVAVGSAGLQDGMSVRVR
jgi:membrane fusion protein (multidrug efflux system)